MYEATVTVNLKCPDHPTFNPIEDYVPKGCKCCTAMDFVKQWLWMADRKASQIDSGFYKRKSGDPVEATQVLKLDDIADVATGSPTSAPTEAPEDEAVLVNEPTESGPRQVRRKVAGGGRMKIKSAPQ